MNELGTFIKKHRMEKELSVRKLAELAKISHTEIKRIEDGKRLQPSPANLRAISTALGVSYEEIMAVAGYIDDRPSQVVEGTVTSGITNTEDLSPEEIEKVNDYINYLISKRQ